MFRRFLKAAVLLGLWSASATAHDLLGERDVLDPERLRDSRLWTHASGLYQVRGSFVAINQGQVRILKDDGHPLDIKLSALDARDRVWAEAKNAEIQGLNQKPRIILVSQQRTKKSEPDALVKIREAFKPFEDQIKTRSDDDFFYVESNGIPDHRMMVGITAWQQQVPLPQPYTGENAWRIPLYPKPAAKPISAKTHFFRGAIAMAVNGVPIFNPIKNDGRTDTLIAGELDEFGGHCGRADDYHYHIAPVHLEPKVGKGKPLGYALDGYPILGYDEADGSKVRKLDVMNGHDDEESGYHYHATKKYPYLNGGFHGEVVERDGQVDPQPNAQPVRPAGEPLRGATITGFKTTEAGRNELVYKLKGEQYQVAYSVAKDGTVSMEFTDPRGSVEKETYSPRNRPRPGQGKGQRKAQGKGQGKGGRRPPPPDRD